MMRAKGLHSFVDRLMRANIKELSDKQLLIAICADSPSSSDKSCLARGIHGQTKKQVGAVAQILRDYPEQILFCRDDLAEMVRIKTLIDSLAKALRIEVLKRLTNNYSARSLEGNAGKLG